MGIPIGPDPRAVRCSGVATVAMVMSASSSGAATASVRTATSAWIVGATTFMVVLLFGSGGADWIDNVEGRGESAAAKRIFV
ncbi:MAG: hypothetical protein WA931_13070 [Rhodococcus sp. (in: high G+C Gram-positive bacteria)]